MQRHVLRCSSVLDSNCCSGYHIFPISGHQVPVGMRSEESEYESMPMCMLIQFRLCAFAIIHLIAPTNPLWQHQHGRSDIF